MNNNFNRKLFCLLFITSILIAFPSDKKRYLDETTNKIDGQSKSRVIIGQAATLIIISNDNTNARVLADIFDVSQGGKVRKLHRRRNINANVKAGSEKEELDRENEIALPLKFTIEKAYPNPFNPVVNIRFGLPKDAPVNILIYDVTGRIIGDYKVGIRSAGWHEFSWNAADMLGQDVGTGIYLLSIHAGEKIHKQKVTYIK